MIFWLVKAAPPSRVNRTKVMTKPAFIAIDWGTSNARFVLADKMGVRLDETHGPGIAKMGNADAIEATCFKAIGDWIGRGTSLPVLMAGMVGSNIGWREAAYVETPASVEAVLSAALRFEARGARFAILPGVKTNRLGDGLPDLMRGEETQIMGAAEDGLICLPGTHSKWVQRSGGTIETFHTAQTGELLELIGKQSILLNPRRAPAAVVGRAFTDGVKVALTNALGLESLLFTVRSRQVAGDLPDTEADSYLTGLLVGAEIRSALAIYNDVENVQLIGSPGLTTLYAAALDRAGKSSIQIDGQSASLAGLTKAYQEIFA